MGDSCERSATQAGAAGRESTGARDALTQVLTLESRNALSRVELAAGELARLETNPASCERLAAIREAVAELDVLLEKLGLLWLPRVAGEARLVDLQALVEGVRARIEPTLRARGIAIALRSGVGRCQLLLAPVALERLLLCFLRLGLGSIRGGEGLELETQVEDEGIALILSRAEAVGEPLSRCADRTRLLELELQLAELGGRLSDAIDQESLRLWIPGRSEADA